MKLANEKKTSEELANSLGLANAFTVKQRDTMTIPYGRSLNGKKLQVFDRAGADEMVADFANERKADSDFAIPVYIGHPDVPEFAKDYPDKAAYAWCANIAAEPQGLVCQLKWSEAGEKILANAHYKWPSPYWACRQSSVKANEVHPVKLISIGLTNMPNIRAIGALVNSAQAGKGDGAMREMLLKMLGLAADATDEQIAEASKDVSVPTMRTANADLQTKVAAGETALANEKTAGAAALSSHAAKLAEKDAALASANAAVKVERAARIEMLANAAVADGRITLAQKPQWIVDLTADFDTKAVALANVKKVLPTESKTLNLGNRKPEMMDRQTKVIALVNEELKKTPDYVTAFANVTKANPDLFAQMSQPKRD